MFSSALDSSYSRISLVRQEPISPHQKSFSSSSSSLGVFLSEAPYTAVYQGLWGYNALLTSGALVYFVVPTPSGLLAAVVGSVLVAVVQAASDHVFTAVSSMRQPMSVYAGIGVNHTRHFFTSVLEPIIIIMQ